MSKRIPEHLWQCANVSEQKDWCRAQFEDGKTLTDPGLFLGGADPDKIVRSLRRGGFKIQTCFVRTVDAAGQVHPRTLAWRRPVQAQHQPAGRASE